MVRLIFWFAVLVAATFAITWIADSPGTVSITVRGYQIETQSIGLVVFAIAALFVAIWIVWGIFKWLIGRPSAIGGFFGRRRERKGRAAMSTGLVAIGAGDDVTAAKAAQTALRLMPDEPLAQLLAAQSAKKQGDTAQVKHIYREMTKGEETRLLGLRGLFDEARREKDFDKARDIAKQALSEHPGVSWASNAMLVSYGAQKDWPAILLLLDNQQKTGLISKSEAARKRAVVLTAQAMEAEDSDTDTALDLGLRAHKLDPSLVPAAVVTARAYSAQGAVRRAARVLEKTWRITPHPDIAEVYAHIRPGDSVKDRLNRVKALVRGFHGGEEGALAVARAAIDATEWAEAREALKPVTLTDPSVRVCTMMAELETADGNNTGKAREWLARAVNARRDPAWTAGSYVSADWLPLSPVTGELGVFEWKVPVEGEGYTQAGQISIAEVLTRLEPAPARVAKPDVRVISDKPEANAKTDENDTDDITDIEPEVVADKTPPETAQDKASDTDEKPEPDDKAEAPIIAQTPPLADDKQAGSPAKKADEKATMAHPPDDPGPKKPGSEKPGESWFG